MEFYILTSLYSSVFEFYRYISKDSNQIKYNLLLFLLGSNQVNLYFILYKIFLKQSLVFLSSICLESQAALLYSTTVFMEELFLWALQYVLCMWCHSNVTQRLQRLTNICEPTDLKDPQFLSHHLSLCHLHGFPSNFWEKYFFSHPEETVEQTS